MLAMGAEIERYYGGESWLSSEAIWRRTGGDRWVRIAFGGVAVSNFPSSLFSISIIE